MENFGDAVDFLHADIQRTAEDDLVLFFEIEVISSKRRYNEDKFTCLQK